MKKELNQTYRYPVLLGAYEKALALVEGHQDFINKTIVKDGKDEFILKYEYDFVREAYKHIKGVGPSVMNENADYSGILQNFLYLYLKGVYDAPKDDKEKDDKKA